MPTARAKQINLEATSYYHCYNRCVRKGYLFGMSENNKSYDHRKGWVIERFRYLAKGFAIDVCAYAIMSNHYHLVLHVNENQAKAWSKEEINERWKWVLNRKTELPPASEEEIERRRNNLFNISWFMRFLNEHIARLANKEDKAKGRFWESRFQSQALVDEGALLACMAYVDLNPIRAKMAKTLEDSDYTSIQERLTAYQKGQETPETLLSFQAEEVKPNTEKVTLPFSRQDYLTLIDWTGRQLREDKAGFISSDIPSLVQESGLNPAHWLKTIEKSGIREQSIVGSLLHMKAWANKIKQGWLKGQKLASLKYLPT